SLSLIIASTDGTATKALTLSSQSCLSAAAFNSSPCRFLFASTQRLASTTSSGEVEAISTSHTLYTRTLFCQPAARESPGCFSPRYGPHHLSNDCMPTPPGGLTNLPHVFPAAADRGGRPMKLTAQTLAKYKWPDKPDHIVFDDDIAGFGLRSRNGRRSWIFQY